MFDVIGDLDWYGLDFPVCNAKQGKLTAQTKALLKYAHPKLHQKLTDKLAQKNKMLTEMDAKGELPDAATFAAAAASTHGKKLGYNACITDWFTQYFNKPEVKAALHANENVTWSECSDSITYSYEDQMDYMEVIYKFFLDNTDLKIMIVSGDDDSICATLGTQSWVWAMGYDVVAQWKAWYYKDPYYGSGQVGGYKTQWVGNNTDATLTLVTVHGAGHEVPMYQPMKASHAFGNFINDVW